jgi:hypothetical protein
MSHRFHKQVILIQEVLPMRQKTELLTDGKSFIIQPSSYPFIT